MVPQERDDVARWARLIEAEYLEMPGLRLTQPQVQRLWGLDSGFCERLLGVMVDAHVLAKTGQNTYVLATTTRH